MKDLSTELVDALTDVHGEHEGFRAVHAKGVCVDGEFTASPEAATFCRAAHMQGDPIRTTVRFSNGSGKPDRHDGARDGRGMATRFHLPDGGATDIVALTLPAFFVRNPDDFLEFTRLQRPDPETGRPDFARIEQYVAEHPETQLAIGFQMFEMPPASFAQLRFFAIHAFKWIDSGGGERFVRYRWEPRAGVASITEEESRARSRTYLQEELRDRLQQEPIGFDLHVQIAEEEDDPTDPTTPWPDERRSLVAGHLRLTALIENQRDGCESLIFDPTRVTDGIECSDDKILLARPGAYSISYDRRTST